MTTVQDQPVEVAPRVRKEMVLELADYLRKARAVPVSKEEIAASVVEKVQAILDSQQSPDEANQETETVPLYSSHSMWFTNALNFFHRARRENNKQEAVVFLITAAHDYCRSVIPQEYPSDAFITDEVVELDMTALETLKTATLNYLSGADQDDAVDSFHLAARYLLKVESEGKGRASKATRCTVDAGYFVEMTKELKVGVTVDSIKERTRRNLLNLILTIHDVEETIDFSVQVEDESS